VALNLVLHTFRMIFGNFGQALRVSVGPYLLLMILAGVVFVVFGQGMTGTQVNGQMPPGFALGFILLIPLFLFVTAWVAVSWHRFILLEEYAGILPAVTDRPIWPYAGKVILMSLLMMVAMIPLMLVFMIIGVPFIEAPGHGVGRYDAAVGQHLKSRPKLAHDDDRHLNPDHNLRPRDRRSSAYFLTLC